MWTDRAGFAEDIVVRGYRIPLSKRTCVMGILNVTPDSFSDGGQYFETRQAVKKALEMADQGADLIDIGGVSSRPGATTVDAGEEMERVIPVIKALKGLIEVPLSIDTCRASVALEALKNGAVIVNDITALNGDPAMAEIIAEYDAGVILMHMKGEPGTMQKNPVYDDVIAEIMSYLSGSIRRAVDADIEESRIIVDPGIGFGKSLHDNLLILNGLRQFRELGCPLLVGPSRKSFIGEITGRKTDERFFGTAASVAVAVMHGADIIRAHDVGPMLDVTFVADAIEGAG